jgi:hypothetical protein
LSRSVGDQKSAGSALKDERALQIKESGGRVLRWVVGSVLFSAVPIFVSLLFLPTHTQTSAVFGHGDLAVLATALASASIAELIGPDRPGRAIQGTLIMACVLLLMMTTVLLCGIAAHAQRLSTSLDVRYSWYALFVSLAIGAVSWAITTHGDNESRSD